MNENLKLTEMLRYMRPEGSYAQKVFCQTFLEPVFGQAVDAYGNYLHIVPDEAGNTPKIAFTAHHDTVHKQSGTQYILVQDGVITAPQSDCLGADCTTGVWLILQMIYAGVPGVYIVHGGEEIGCVGSSAFVRENEDFVRTLDAVISFDRRGVKDIITFQMGCRTASDEFAVSLAEALDNDMLLPCDGGAYTDSNEYAELVPECTNLSVGYYSQHTRSESQDLFYAYKLLGQLLNADWTKIVIKRDPEMDFESSYRNMYSGGFWRNQYEEDEPYLKYKSSKTSSSYNRYLIECLLTEYPDECAEMFDSWGFSYESLVDDLVRENPHLTAKLVDFNAKGYV